MGVSAVRTLPDGGRCESRTTTDGHGWFGLVDQPDVDCLDAGNGVSVLVDRAARHVVAVSSDRGKVTDSVMFYALRWATGASL